MDFTQPREPVLPLLWPMGNTIFPFHCASIPNGDFYVFLLIHCVLGVRILVAQRLHGHSLLFTQFDFTAVFDTVVSFLSL